MLNVHGAPSFDYDQQHRSTLDHNEKESAKINPSTFSRLEIMQWVAQAAVLLNYGAGSLIEVSDAFADDVETIDDDIPESHRRISFVTAKNSQELIASHLGKSFGSKLRHWVGDLFFGPIHVRAVFSMLVACVLCTVCCSYRQPQQRQEWIDLCVYCVVYGAWFVFCVPMLLATINMRLVVQVLHVLFRVFFAEIAVIAYAYCRGHNNVLRRGFSLFPTLEANRSGRGLAWLGEAGYNLRLASLISCFVIAFVITCMEIRANRSFAI